MKLSIIIPYYNRPNEINNLIEALKPQLNEKVEVIIVDDCSDKPLNYNIPQIKIIRLEENSGGASVPRNVGLDNATGEYIAFIDSDDMVSNDYIETILQKTKEDWDYCFISWECNSRKVIINNMPPRWNCSVWNCIYKREKIGNTRFREDLKIAEDFWFSLKVKKGKKANITKILYYYEEYSPDSLVNAGITYNDKYKKGANMKYVIMCGGNYDKFKTPKHLTKINGERLVDRTIRLLKENGIKSIFISSNNPMFDTCGVPRLEHKNSFVEKGKNLFGYWLDAYYPFENNDKVCYLYGDVYYSENAIKTIVNNKQEGNILFGTSAAKNEFHQNWGEPFAYKVNDNKVFKEGIKAVKRLQDEGKLKRMAITWELYRYLNNLDVNVQQVLDETYVFIDDETMDIDNPEEVKELEKAIKE